MNLDQARYRVIRDRSLQQVRGDRNPNLNNRQQTTQRWGTVYSGVIGIVATNEGRDGATGRYLLSTPDGSQVPGQAIGRGGITTGRPLGATVLDGSGAWAIY